MNKLNTLIAFLSIILITACGGAIVVEYPNVALTIINVQH